MTETIDLEKARVEKEIRDEAVANLEKPKVVLTSGLAMRELQGDDIFTVFAMLDKMGVANKLTEFLKQREDSRDILVKRAGYQVIIDKDPKSKEGQKALKEIEKITANINDQSFDIIGDGIKLVLANLNTIKKELNAFLSSVLVEPKTAEEVGKLPIKTYIGLVKDFFVKPELKDLFELFNSLT